MGKNIILLSVALFFLPGLVMGDCLDVRGFTSWYVQGSHRLILYRGMTPLAHLDIPYCALSSSSEIRLLKSYLCDGDKILVDGDDCTILAVSSQGFFY
jgi:hypothetical protein